MLLKFKKADSKEEFKINYNNLSVVMDFFKSYTNVDDYTDSSNKSEYKYRIEENVNRKLNKGKLDDLNLKEFEKSLISHFKLKTIKAKGFMTGKVFYNNDLCFSYLYLNRVKMSPTYGSEFILYPNHKSDYDILSTSASLKKSALMWNGKTFKSKADLMAYLLIDNSPIESYFGKYSFGKCRDKILPSKLTLENGFSATSSSTLVIEYAIKTLLPTVRKIFGKNVQVRNNTILIGHTSTGPSELADYAFSLVVSSVYPKLNTVGITFYL